MARENSAGVKLSISITMKMLQCMKGEIILTVLKKYMHFSAAAIHFFPLNLLAGNVHILMSPLVPDISHTGVHSTAAVYLLIYQVTAQNEEQIGMELLVFTK